MSYNLDNLTQADVSFLNKMMSIAPPTCRNDIRKKYIDKYNDGISSDNHMDHNVYNANQWLRKTCSHDEIMINSHKTIPLSKIEEKLRNVPLKGYDGHKIYEHARINFTTMNPKELAPAQKYVLSRNLYRTRILHDEFILKGIDTLALDKGLLYSTEYGSYYLIPPVVEVMHDEAGNDIHLINDGMHRIYTALQMEVPIMVTLISGVPERYPYYAAPAKNGWVDVNVYSGISEVKDKRDYVDFENRKDLYRDFNAVFPGVQPKR